MATLVEKWKSFWQENEEYLYQTHKELCLIPAPSHFEDERAKYCKAWLENVGAKGVFMDEAKNVIYPMNCEGSNQITVVNAHTDTVFPMETPLNFMEEDGIIRCPGVGDDTACLVEMLFAIKFFLENNWQPKNGILFVCNSCEEGLGNLYGIRQIYKDYAGRIVRHIAIDAEVDEIFNRCVGSYRYEVTVLTKGGHSYSAFGNRNAIAEAAKMISKIYDLKVPEKAGERTTYNVGIIQGGTSVNTIAQNVSFLCEYRSTDAESMDIMEKAFQKIFAEAQTDEVKLKVELVGERPCARGVDQNEIDRLTDLFSPIIQEVTGKPAKKTSASTDCNIPLSLGIPAVCIGTMISGGTHTTEEWMEKSSFVLGFELLVKSLFALLESGK